MMMRGLIEQEIYSYKNKYESPIVTKILPLETFYSAEEYHQKYLVKNPGGCHISLPRVKRIFGFQGTWFKIIKWQSKEKIHYSRPYQKWWLWIDFKGTPTYSWTGRLVVIKKIKPEIINNPELKKSFIDEIRTTFPLNHPNIAQTIDYGEEDGQLFCVLEYIQGVTLREIQKKLDKTKGHIDLTHIIYIVMESAKGLHYAHQYKDQFQKNFQRIVHRDISPQNIMVNFDGMVKVIDFGIAKAKSNVNTTQAGVYKGKPAYMAPEYISPGIYDHRFDQFSLGVVFGSLSREKNFLQEKKLY